MWENASAANYRNILKLADRRQNSKLLDLGCSDGKWTIELGEKIGSTDLYGVELGKDAVLSRQKGIRVEEVDLNERLPYKSNFFDVVHSNQVIEHLTHVDGYLSEIRRVLKSDGYSIISTENLSSVLNISALVLGQQAFSQHISEKRYVGNVFSPHYGENIEDPLITHKTLFTYFGLKHILEMYDLRVTRILAAGFIPFPGVLARIDPVHGHFLAVKVAKKLGG